MQGVNHAEHGKHRKQNRADDGGYMEAILEEPPEGSTGLVRLERPDIHQDQPKKLAGTYDSFNIRFDYHAVVNYNSGPGIQAAIAGVRPIVHKTSLAYPVSIAIDNIDQPYDLDRHQWLTEICHTEYTLDEIKQAQWLKRILPALTA